MIEENIKLFLRLYYRPMAAMSDIIDRGSWLFGAVAVAAVSVLLQFSVISKIYSAYHTVSVAQHHPQPGAKAPPAEDEEEENAGTPEAHRLPLPVVGDLGWRVVSFSSTSTFASVLTLALLYVPFAIFLMVLFEHPGSFSVVLQRDYAALLACAFMSWAAAHLPFALGALAGGAIKPNVYSFLALWLGGKVFFAVLMVCALRTVFGSGFGTAIATVSIAWTSAVLESSLAWLASPFILYWGYTYFRGDVGDILSSFRTRQGFRRYLEASTVNPRDSEAHYQLGLIYQQRHQHTEATARFRQAIEIDPDELDAHYQLGRMAHSQGRFDEALEHFKAVVAKDDGYAQGEVWRALGESYAAASKNDEARAALERYVERRSYDPEGLYYLGETLFKLGENQQAREMFGRCVEAEKTNPYRRHSQTSKWRRFAEKRLRSLPA